MNQICIFKKRKSVNYNVEVWTLAQRIKKLAFVNMRKETIGGIKGCKLRLLFVGHL